MECNRQNIFAAADRCQFFKDYCSSEENYNQFVDIYICKINSSIPLFVLLSVIFILVIFHLLSSTAEQYLSSALSYISKKFNFSQTLAGVTLLAFGNGAPDVITSFAAGGEEEGVEIAIGSLLGAGIFVTTFVVFLCIVSNGQDILVSKVSFLRDIGFYLLAVSSIILFALIGKITLVMAVLFALLYLLVVIIEIKTKNEETTSLESSLMSAQSLSVIEENENEQESILHNDSTDLSTFIKEDHVPSVLNAIRTSQTGLNKPNRKLKIRNQQSWFVMKFNYQMKKLLDHQNNQFSSLTLFEKFIYVYEIPVNFVRNLTIPQSDEELYNKNYALCWPIFSPLFLILVGTVNVEIKYYFFCLPLFILVSALIWKTSHQNKTPSYLIVYSIFGFVLSLIWINFQANLLVNYLKLVGLLTGFPNTFIGLTFLAWGNSLSDAFANPALAKMGYAIMAITGCFAGQLFNTLVGFGSTLIKSASKGDIEFDLFNPDKLDKYYTAVIVVVLAFFNLVVSLIIIILQKFRMGKIYAWYLCIVYITFIISTTVIVVVRTYF